MSYWWAVQEVRGGVSHSLPGGDMSHGVNKWSNVYVGIRDLDTGHHIASDPLWNVRVSPSPWAGFQARPNNPFLQQLRTDMEAYILHKSKLILSCNPQLVWWTTGEFQPHV